MIRFRIRPSKLGERPRVANRTDHPRWNETPNTYGTDEFNMSIVPSGLRDSQGFRYIGEWFYFPVRCTIDDLAYRCIGFPNYINQFSTLYAETNNNPLDLHLVGGNIGLAVRLRAYTTVEQDALSDGTILPNAHTDRDGNSYDGVKIGSYIWLTKNYKCTQQSNGDWIEWGTFTDNEWTQATSRLATYYTIPQGNLTSIPAMIDAYGLLYNFESVQAGLGGAGNAGFNTFGVPTYNDMYAFVNYLNGYNTKIRSIYQIGSPYVYYPPDNSDIRDWFIDLPDEFGFSFNYNNSVFAFENMQLSRSGEFQIPRTPKNDKLLGFGHDFVKDGDTVRKSMSAQLFYDGGLIDGIIYISKYGNGEYSAVFVYGELSVLKNALDAGVIGEYITVSDSLPTTGATIRSGYSQDGQMLYNFAWIKYKNLVQEQNWLVSGMNLSPVVKLEYLLSKAATKLGINLNSNFFQSAFVRCFGLILPTQKASPVLENCNIYGITNSTLNLIGGENFLEVGVKSFKYQTDFFGLWKEKDCVVYFAKRDCSIRFNTAYTQYAVVNDRGRNFLTERFVPNSFGYINSGSVVELKTGDYFSIVSKDDYWFDTPVSSYGGYVNVSFDIYGGDDTEVDLGETYYLQPNLPEVTFIDLLKTVANLLKCGINYDEVNNEITLFDFNYNRENSIDLDGIIIDIKSVDRTFLNYARRNYVDFKSDDYVKAKYGIDYYINNDNLLPDKKLYTVPFSDGMQATGGNVEVRDFDSSNGWKKVAKNPTICVPSRTVGNDYLQHISNLYVNFPSIDGASGSQLKNIINDSTTIVVQARMSTARFLSIKNTDSFKYRGRHFCCVKANHSGGVAELTLVKLPVESTGIL